MNAKSTKPMKPTPIPTPTEHELIYLKDAHHWCMVDLDDRKYRFQFENEKDRVFAYPESHSVLEYNGMTIYCMTEYVKSKLSEYLDKHGLDTTRSSIRGSMEFFRPT